MLSRMLRFHVQTSGRGVLVGLLMALLMSHLGKSQNRSNLFLLGSFFFFERALWKIVYPYVPGDLF